MRGYTMVKVMAERLWCSRLRLVSTAADLAWLLETAQRRSRWTEMLHRAVKVYPLWTIDEIAICR